MDVPNKISGPGNLVLARYSWYGDGSIAGIWDARNNLTRYTHEQPSVMISAGAKRSVTYNFDLAGKLSSIKSSSADTQWFSWVAVGVEYLMSSVSSPLRSTSIKYDSDGNAKLITGTAGSISTVTTNIYRLVTASDPQPHILTDSSVAMASTPTTKISSVKYDYGVVAPNVYLSSVKNFGADGVQNNAMSITPDKAGRPGTVTVNGRVKASYTYDVLGRVDTFTDAKQISSKYTYDSKNRATGVSTQATGFSQSVTRDKGRVDSVTTPVGTASFEFEGSSSRVTKATKPDSSAVSMLYDAAGRVFDQTSTSSTGDANQYVFSFSPDNTTKSCKFNRVDFCSQQCMSNSAPASCPIGSDLCSCKSQIPGPNGLCCRDKQTGVCAAY